MGCSTKAHSRGIDSGEGGRAFRRGWWWKAREAFPGAEEYEVAPHAPWLADPPVSGAGPAGFSATCQELGATGRGEGAEEVLNIWIFLNFS